MIEVLFVCESNDNNVTCTAWDFRTGTNLMTYKGGGSAQMHSLCLMRTEYVLAANSSKPLLHVWPINAQEQLNAVRFVVPGCVHALILSPCGNYLLAAIQETIYIWHVATGRMLNTIAKHYQPVTCLRFTNDSSHFVSASRDGGVIVWNLTQVVARSDNNVTPRYVFNDHGLPVTDVHIGVGGMRAYMFTVSLDRTCKVYDLNSGTLLLSVVFGEGLQCIAVNPLETSVFVGSVEGNIFEFHIDSLPRTKEYHTDEQHTNRLQGHKAGTAVNCLALSCDGQTLISGGLDQQICVWHIASRQLVRTFVHKGPISNMLLRPTMLSVFQPEHKQPHVFGGNLRRMIDAADTDEQMVINTLVTQADITAREEWQVNTSVRAMQTSAAPDAVQQTAASENSTQEELQELRAEVLRLRHINKELFDTACQELLKTN